jgi:hypothetical protein
VVDSAMANEKKVAKRISSEYAEKPEKRPKMEYYTSVMKNTVRGKCICI